MEVPAAPEEPFSHHHPPPFSRIPTPTVFYLGKVLIQWMQPGLNSCTSGLLFPDVSLGCNTLLDKHCIFARCFCKSLKKITDNKPTVNVKKISSNSLPNSWHNIQEIWKKLRQLAGKKFPAHQQFPFLFANKSLLPASA